MIAILEKKQGRLQSARYALGSALRSQPGHVQSAHQLALLDLESGRVHAAQRCVQDALKKNPHSARLRLLNDDIEKKLMLTNSPEQRLEHQQKAVDEEPLNGIFIRNLMKTLRVMHKHKEAMELGLSKLQDENLRFRTEVVVETAYHLSMRSLEGSLDLLQAEISTFPDHGTAPPPHNLVKMKLTYARLASRRGQAKERYHKALAMLDGHERWVRKASVEQAKETRDILNSRLSFRVYQPNLFRS